MLKNEHLPREASPEGPLQEIKALLKETQEDLKSHSAPVGPLERLEVWFRGRDRGEDPEVPERRRAAG
jgi:hypothetical protein